MYLYYTFYDLLFAQNCSYETSSFKNKPILKFSVPIYHEYIYDNFCWKVFDKRNLTWFDWDTYYMRGSRIFFSWGRDDGVCPGGVGVGGVPRLFSFYFLYLINYFNPTPPSPLLSRSVHVSTYFGLSLWKKNISIFLQLSSTRFYKEFLLCQKRDIMLGFLLQLICHDVKILNNFFLGLLLWCYSFIIISYILSRCRKP